MDRGHVRGAAVLAAVVLAVPACAPGGGGETVTVLAASSLADAFRAVADAYEARAGGVDVRLSVAGSQRLATQVLEGAPADVFASADRRQMDRVVDAGLATDDPRVVAHNELAIAVPAGNPRGVDGIHDLADPDLAVVLAAPEVPAGRYTRQALDAAGVSVAPVSLEADVRSVLAKVALGEADAGVVYVSDVVASDADVEAVGIPAARNVVADYPVAVVTDAPNPAGARAFVAFLHAARARAILERFGFRVEGGA